MGGRASSRVLPSTQAYLDIAKKYHLDPIHMSLAWYKYRPFKAIPIIGATNVEQLKCIVESVGVNLRAEILQEITDAHKANPMPY